MKMNHIRWIAIVGLIAIVELQYVWLVNTYKLTNPTLTLQRKISLFSMFFVSETADNQFCVCR